MSEIPLQPASTKVVTPDVVEEVLNDWAKGNETVIGAFARLEAFFTSIIAEPKAISDESCAGCGSSRSWIERGRRLQALYGQERYVKPANVIKADPTLSESDHAAAGMDECAMCSLLLQMDECATCNLLLQPCEKHLPSALRPSTGEVVPEIPNPPDTKRYAAVSLIERDDGRLLCVWNRRYHGWALPGGLVEKGEDVVRALARELREETSLEMMSSVLVFQGEHGMTAAMQARPGRASDVCVFRVTALGTPQAVEDGCPTTWLTRQEFIETSPFGGFYRRVFEHVKPRTEAEVHEPSKAWLDEMVALHALAGQVRWFRKHMLHFFPGLRNNVSVARMFELYDAWKQTLVTVDEKGEGGA